jgi:hypothetical protein
MGERQDRNPRSLGLKPFARSPIMRIARALCFTLPLALSSLAAGATTVAVDRDAYPAESVSGAAFDADPGLGRAWVVVRFVDHADDDEQIISQRLLVPGLTYDVATRTIHLQDGDRDVTCAVGKKVLWATRFSSTSQCPIRVHQLPEEKAEAYRAAAGEKAHFVVEVGNDQ